jgi:transporter family protein
VKNFVVLSLIAVFQAFGNVYLSRGMRQVGELDVLDPSALLAFALRAVINPWVVLGVALLIAFFLVYLAALSWLELSYVLPMTASSYVLTALLAWLMLGEAISVTRWAGTLAICVDVLIDGRSERKKDVETDRRAHPPEVVPLNAVGGRGEIVP